MKRKIIFFLKYYFPAIIWMAAIFYLSSVPSLSTPAQDTISEIILRKAAHFFEFAILGGLLFRVFYAGYKFQTRYAFFWSLILAGLFGASDEIHQVFVSGRTGKVIDASYDALSALFLLEFLVIIKRRKVNWKNILIVAIAVLGLLGLELKMISDSHAGGFSFSQMKIELYYSSKHNWNYFSGKGKAEESVGIGKEEVSLQESQISQSENAKTDTDAGVDSSGKKPLSPIPVKFILENVPFTPQAPQAVWDEIHEEACEEASLVILKYFLDGETLDKAAAEKEIQGLVEFQIENYGDYKDTNAEETVRLAKDYYGMENLRVVYDFQKEDLKKYLALGNPIIIPAAGRLLSNPFFTPPGPLYHNLVLIGYDGDTIITNDPGTRRGAGYEYDIDVLFSAIHDFPGRVEDIEKGRKAMIMVEE